MKLLYNDVRHNVLHVKVDTRKECYNWGLDNAFPSLIEALTVNSVTARECSKKVSKAIYGKGFGEVGKVKVNTKNQTLNEVARIASKQYAKFWNVFIHVGYNANLDINSITVVPCTDVRVGKDDDLGYSGKYIVYNNWDKKKYKYIKQSDFITYYAYNSNKEIIEKQIRNSVGYNRKNDRIEDLIQDYNGQILHIKGGDEYIYSLPSLYPVMGEALLEANSQTFRSLGAENGFLNTKILAVPPFESEKARKKFIRDMEGLRGAENSGSVYVIELAQVSEDVEKQLGLKDLSNPYNDSLFEYSDKQAEKNICKAFEIPPMLISQAESSLFGSSGELLREAKVQVWENNEESRDQIEEVFNELLGLFDEKRRRQGLTFINPYENINPTNTVE